MLTGKQTRLTVEPRTTTLMIRYAHFARMTGRAPARTGITGK